MTRDFEDHCWRGFVDEETEEIYSHYKRDVFVGENPAVLMVDVYKASYEGGQQRVIDVIKEHPSSCGERAWAMVEPAKQLLEASRAAGIPITYCTGDTRSSSNKGRATNRQVLNEHNESYDILEELAPEDGELVVYKQRASAFYGTPLMSHLTQMGIQSLIMGGGTTSGCLRAAVQDAKANGFHVTLVEECCYDRTEMNHMVNLFDMHHKYADVMHLDEVLNHINGMGEVKKAS
jgi:nicotinamidase-related amidase